MFTKEQEYSDVQKHLTTISQESLDVQKHITTISQESLDVQKKIKTLLEKFKLNTVESSSTLFIILIIILLLADYASLYEYNIELKNFKYLISYKELLLINTSIITILGLFAIITRRIPQLFLYTFTILLTFTLFFKSEDKGFIEILFISLCYCVIILLILGTRKINDTLIKISNLYIFIIINFILSIFISFFLYSHFGNTLNYKWNNINFENNKYSFKKDSIIETFLNQKLFTTNRLEKLQNDIEFINSDLFIKELIDEEIIKNNNLRYKDFYINYLPNDKYQSFFIIKDKNENEYANKFLNENSYTNNLYENKYKQENVLLYIILTNKYSIDKFQIIDIIKKELKVNYEMIEDKGL